MLELILSFVGILVGITGILIGIYIARREQKKKHTLYWEDLPKASKELAIFLQKHFIPDVIVVPNEKGCILVSMIKPYLNKYIPCFVGVGFDKRQWNPLEQRQIYCDEKQYIYVESNKWNTYISKTIVDYSQSKILVIDDIMLSGDFITNFKKALVASGIASDNIKTMSLITTQLCLDTHNEPDYYWKAVESHEFYMPWGKAK